MKIIGIDLGTTRTKVTYFNESTQRIDQFQFENSEYFIDSVLYFDTKGKVTVGQDAHPINKTRIGGIKRLIGQKYSTERIDEIIQSLGLTAHPDKHDEIVIVLNENTPHQHEFSPIEISALILSKVRFEIERRLNIKNIQEYHVIITVPARFSDEQKNATKIAGQVAGLNVLQIITEPLSAAYASEFDMEYGDYFTFDLGGGTLDTTIFRIGEDSKVLATHGDLFLGGIDIDENVYELIKLKIAEENEEFAEKIEIDEGDDQRVKNSKLRKIEKLKKLAENVKIQLSMDTSVTLNLHEIQNLSEDDENAICITITRDEFDEVNEEIYAKCERIIDETFKKIPRGGRPIKPSTIKKCILIGGSCHIPYIKKFLSEKFNGKITDDGIDCDYIVSKGPCVFYQKRFGEQTSHIRSVIQDVVSYDISIRSVDDKNNEFNAVIVKEGTLVPLQRSFEAEVGYGSAIVDVYENDRQLGSFQIDNIQEKFIQMTLTISISHELTIEGHLANQQIRKAYNTTRKNVCSDDVERMKSHLLSFVNQLN